MFEIHVDAMGEYRTGRIVVNGEEEYDLSGRIVYMHSLQKINFNV